MSDLNLNDLLTLVLIFTSVYILALGTYLISRTLRRIHIALEQMTKTLSGMEAKIKTLTDTIRATSMDYQKPDESDMDHSKGK